MLYDDDLKPFRPRKPRRAAPEQQPTLRGLLLRRLGTWSGRSGTKPRARVAVRPARTFDRRCIVKARVVMAGGAQDVQSGERLAASTRAHLAYVEREGVERDGSPGKIYGAEPLRAAGASDFFVDAERKLASDRELQAASPAPVIRGELLMPVAGEKHQFRLIVSPEDGSELDLTIFTRDLMRQIEQDTGRRLIWGAVNHYNTDNPHVHLVIRGVDRDGDEVRLDREYISNGIRLRAQEIVTRELGPRTVDHYRQQLQREVRQGRLTSIDRKILKRVVDNFAATEKLSPIEIERLRVLEQMGLAVREVGGYRLSDGWDKDLKAASERGDIIKQMHAAAKGDVARYQIVRRFEAAPRDPYDDAERGVHGRVVAKGLSDRTPDAMYAVIETPSGSTYYVPLWRSEIEAVREGDLVVLRQLADSWTHPFDPAIDVLAREGQGALAESSLQVEIEARLSELAQAGIGTVNPSGAWALPTDFVEQVQDKAPHLHRKDGPAKAIDALIEHASRDRDQNLHVSALLEAIRDRMKLLADVPLAVQIQVGAWQVEPGFRARLDQLDHDQPKCHISMRKEQLGLHRQLTYLGPTWMDGVKPTQKNALGRELVALCSERETFLVAQGVQPATHTTIGKLRQLERDALLARVAEQLGFSAGKVGNFRGRFDRVAVCPNGNRYAVILNESDRRVVVVAVGKKASQRVGREVELKFEKSEYDGRVKLAIKPIRGRPSHERQNIPGRGD